MAGRQGLTRLLLTRRALVCLGGVVLAHLVLLQWLQGLMTGPAALRPLAEPMFTRVLVPQEPPAVAPASTAEATAHSTDSPGGLQAVTASPPAPAAATPALPASAPSTALPVAVPDTAAPPAAPLHAASAPTLAASAPIQVPGAALAIAPVPAQPASAATPAAPDPWPRDTRVQYRLEGEFRGGGLYGSAQVQWQRQDGRYQARISIDLGLFGTQSMTSQGEVTPQQLIPRVYEEQRRNRRRVVRLEDAVVVLADGRQMERPAQVQDTASQFIELGHRLARITPVAGQTLDIWLARPGGVDLWTYDIVAQETVTLPRAGEVMAWRLRPRRPASARDNIAAEIWFAPRLQYLPVRILLTQGTEARIDLKVDAIEQR